MVQVPVVAAQTELLPPVHPLGLLPEHPVGEGVEVQAVDGVGTVGPGVGVRSHHRVQPLAEGDVVRAVDGVLDLVAKLHGERPLSIGN